jgi:hypothetical protein
MQTYFSGPEMDRARGPKIVSNALLFVAALAVTMGVGALFILVPATFRMGLFFASLIPLAITICGIVSCLSAGKAANITLLWMILMIVAPLLGPLLWFAWGRNNT